METKPLQNEVVIERVRRVAEARRSGASCSAAQIKSALVAARQVEAWLAAQVAGLIGQLSAIESFPEASIAETSKGSLGQAGRARERSATLSETPSLAAALETGAVTAGHVDAVTRGSRQLDGDQRSTLFERIEALVDVAAAATVGEFDRRVRAEVDRLRADSGEDRLERQRRDARLSSWTDRDGMWNLRGRFDPVSGLGLATKLDDAVEALFAEQTPEHCPSDPIEKQRFLAAHALARLVEGNIGGGRPGRPEYVVVIDADVAGGSGGPGPAVEWPIPVEVPPRVLAALAGNGDVVGVVVRNGVVLHAPGELNLGRTTRLANRAQRRALRGLYRGCAIPGCEVSFERCKLHHVIWWRHGGRTDLDNLLPVCSVHHGRIHHDGWVVELGSGRQLTLRLPDGTIRCTGPPSRRAA